MQAVRDAFPLAMVSETFPHDVDQRIDKILLESCTTRWSVGYAQFWYGSNQFREGYDKDLELVANSIGITALMLAAMEGNVDAARILLRRGASVGLVNCYGRTAIILAAMAGHVEMVKLLLSVDAPIDISDAFGRDALAWAEARGHKHVAILVRKHAHERRDWRMEMLREREAHRAAIAGKMSSGSPSSAGGAIDGARYQPGADAAVDASYDASARSATSSARRETACSSTSFAGPSYAVPTSSHEAVGSARHNRAPFRRIGPIGFGVLSSRKGALPAAVAQRHGLAPVAGAPAAAPVLSPTKASAKSSTTTSTASSVSSASGISSAVSGISSAVSGSFASSSSTSVVSGTPPATGLRPVGSSGSGSKPKPSSAISKGILSVRSAVTAPRRGFLSSRVKPTKGEKAIRDAASATSASAGGAGADEDGGGGGGGGGGGWFARTFGAMSKRTPSPTQPTQALPGAAAPTKGQMADEGPLPGDEAAHQNARWAADVANYDGSARTQGAKSSVRGSARTDFSSARSAVLSTRSMPGFISKFSLGSADGRLGARAGSSTNPNLDLFLATQKAREAGAHGGATSDRGPSNAWEPLPMETLPDSMAARRHHDREWEERLRMKHELRSVDSKKFHSSRRRHWMSSSRRWIERRKEVKASMTPKDRKASRLRLYSSPRHYTTQPRVYT